VLGRPPAFTGGRKEKVKKTVDGVEKEVTVDDEVMLSLRLSLMKMREAKPAAPSEEARRYAVAITDMEKVVAYFNTFVVEKSA